MHMPRPPSNPLRPARPLGQGGRAVLAAGLLALTLSVASPRPAQAQDAAAPTADWTSTAQDWISQQLTIGDDGAAGATGLRPEVIVGSLDTRLRLAPCAQVEPFVPQGTKLWGRSRIGLRCVEGPTRWTVFLPITVKAWGPAWVIRQPVAPGATLSLDDAELTEVDWALSVSPVLPLAEDWVGTQAIRAMMPGQVLRQAMVKSPQVFGAGTQVKVLVEQGAVRLSATGQALTHGYAGQTARVRMPNGRIVTGLVRDGQTVEIEL